MHPLIAVVPVGHAAVIHPESAAEPGVGSACKEGGCLPNECGERGVAAELQVVILQPASALLPVQPFPVCGHEPRDYGGHLKSQRCGDRLHM